MAESSRVISSAVVIPQADPPQITSPQPRKRRQSSTSEAELKRPRLSEQGSPEAPVTLQTSSLASATIDSRRHSKDRSVERRRSDNQEERKRGQRLFGGLLSTLNQRPSVTNLHRRTEIEKKQQEKALSLKAEEEARRTDRLEKLKEARKEEQIKFDEQSLRIRHSNTFATAHFLCTKAEPKVYYKPWELLPQQKDQIDKQILEAEQAVDREVLASERLHPQPAVDNSPSKQVENDVTSTADVKTQAQSESVPTTASALNDSTNDPVPQAHPAPPDGSIEKEVDDNGEEVVEGDEDTVIY